MGVSKDYDHLGELKAVPGNCRPWLAATRLRVLMVRFPEPSCWTILFTEAGMETALEQHPQLVHIASHYVFKPGDDTKSYLLLGGKDTGGQGSI